jgi:hypothetical protein
MRLYPQTDGVARRLPCSSPVPLLHPLSLSLFLSLSLALSLSLSHTHSLSGRKKGKLGSRACRLRSEAGTPPPPASERRGSNLKGFRTFEWKPRRENLTVTILYVPRLSYSAKRGTGSRVDAVNSAHIRQRQSRPDSGLVLQVKYLKTF